MIIQRILFLPIFLLAIPLILFLPGFQTVTWHPVSEVQHASHADYQVLQDQNSQEWIFKQITDPSPDDQVVIVLEKVASEIGYAVNIPLNFVRLVNGDDDFPFRIFPNLPGSLHLKVPGKSALDIPPWEGFDIHQKFRTPFQIARNGPLPPEEIGLRKEVIFNMAKHPDLAKIVALDTFLGNSDRSCGNVFYDLETNCFYGIDMGSCLMGNLAKAAIEKLSLDSDNFQNMVVGFSAEEITGLKQYQQALISLISHFPPEKTLALLTSCLSEAGFVSTNALLWNEDVERKITKWKRQVIENYDSSVELVALLREITMDEYCCLYPKP
jgi:hypothetical protein